MDGLNPGVIAGGVIVLSAITALIVATIIVVWRSSPSAVAARARVRRQRQRQDRKPTVFNVYLTRATTLFSRSQSTKDSAHPRSSDSLWVSKERGDLESDGGAAILTTETSETDVWLPALPTPAVLPHVSHSIASTLNVVISPSHPHLIRIGEDGALEVRITPPSPVHAQKFTGLPDTPNTSGEQDSPFWFL